MWDDVRPLSITQPPSSAKALKSYIMKYIRDHHPRSFIVPIEWLPFLSVVYRHRPLTSIYIFSNLEVIYINILRNPRPEQELLSLAAKARIRRMIAPKKKRSDLAAPEFLINYWHSGTKAKDELAQALKDANWNKDSRLMKEPSGFCRSYV